MWNYNTNGKAIDCYIIMSFMYVEAKTCWFRFIDKMWRIYYKGNVSKRHMSTNPLNKQKYVTNEMFDGKCPPYFP